ncbi:MAG: hypothetical protein AAGC55_10280 [Myxococcota bacterium]
MSITTGVILRGQVDIDVRRRDGRLVETRRIHNKIVDNGLDLMSRLMISGFITNQTGELFVQPLQAIAVGSGVSDPLSPVDPKDTKLLVEDYRRRIESVEILSATSKFVDSGDPTKTVLEIKSKRRGAYGNRLVAKVWAGATESYGITIEDFNNPYWDGSFMSERGEGQAPEVKEYEGATLEALITAMEANPVAQALAPDLSWNGTAFLGEGSDYLSGGGTGVVVSATFSHSATGAVALTEAGLFNTEAQSELEVMFNKVHFPAINITSDLDITFRWKLLFQEASS